jgi:predicted nucleic acid-binding protein
VSLLVDTSVWSLALRRDRPADVPEVSRLGVAIDRSESLLTTGLILQELLQGFAGATAQQQITDRFAAFPLIVPDRRDHIDAAELRNTCRRGGVQVGTIDALLAQLCLRHDLTLLTTDRDFHHIARVVPLPVWSP